MTTGIGVMLEITTSIAVVIEVSRLFLGRWNDYMRRRGGAVMDLNLGRVDDVRS